MSASRARHLLASAAAPLAAVALAAPAPAAERHRFPASDVALDGSQALFPMRRVRPGAVRRARLRVGRVSRRVRARAVRRGARRGRLLLRLGRRTAAAARLHRPWLTVVTRKLAEFDGFSAEHGLLRRTRGGAYDGRRSLFASYDGSGSSGFQRVWRNVRWRSGSDVWYGMALLIPDRSAYCYWNPIRWDNYRTYGGRGDVGGLQVERGALHLIRSRYGSRETKLIGPVTAPEDRWFWLEVHQRLSGRHGRALSEVFVDGRRVGASTRANSAGRVVNDIRFGAVNVAGRCSRAGSILFDRVSVSRRTRGPLPPAWGGAHAFSRR